MKDEIIITKYEPRAFPIRLKLVCSPDQMEYKTKIVTAKIATTVNAAIKFFMMFLLKFVNFTLVVILQSLCHFERKAIGLK